MRYLFKRIKNLIRNKYKGFDKINGDLDKVIIDRTSNIAHPQNLFLDNYVRIGSNCYIDAEGEVDILNGVTLSANVTILSSNHNYKNPKFLPFDNSDYYKKVIIKQGVWIGLGSIILPGVVIGENSIVAAGSVVTKSIEKEVIVGGNPSKIIGKRKISDHLRKKGLCKFYQYQVLEKGLKRRT